MYFIELKPHNMYPQITASFEHLVRFFRVRDVAILQYKLLEDSEVITMGFYLDDIVDTNLDVNRIKTAKEAFK